MNMNREREGERERNDIIELWTDNDIGAEGARMLSEVLKSNSTLTELHLGCDDD